MTILRSIRERLGRAHPDHFAIAGGMAWIALFFLISKLAGAAKEMAIAWRYGVGPEVDAYVFVLSLLSWPAAVWFSVITVVLVPLAARLRQAGQAQLSRFQGEMFALALLIGAGLTVLAEIGLPILLRSSWAGLPPKTALYAVDMAHTLTFVVPLGIMISLFSTWIMASGRQTNTLLESIPAGVLLVGLTIFPESGFMPLVWGTIAGFALHLACTLVPLAFSGGLQAPRFSLFAPEWPEFWRHFAIMLAGSVLMSLISLVDQFFAVRMEPGALASLSYANRILALALGVGAMAVTRASLPVFAQSHVTDSRRLRRTMKQWSLLLFGCGTIGALIGWWIAPWAVRFVFERGAFGAQETLVVSQILRFGLIQLPFYAAGLVLISFLSSHGKFHVLSVIGGLNLVLKVLLNLLFVPIYGVSGLMLSTSLMLAGSFGLLFTFVFLFMPEQGPQK